MKEQGGIEQNLRSLTLQLGPQISDWDLPESLAVQSDLYRSISFPSRMFQATRDMSGGATEGKFHVRQIRGPTATPLEELAVHEDQYKIELEAKRAGEEADKSLLKYTKAYLDTMPPAVLREMIKANTSSDNEDSSYEIQTRGWRSKLADYEAKWKESRSKILPMLKLQLQERKEHGWKLWDMPLMQSDIGSEGFLYDRMAEREKET